MSTVIGVLLFLLGLAVGSFLNCLVYRLNEDERGLRSLWGRSYCPNCKKNLLWYDNLPLLSFLFLKGRCRWCHSPIGFHYPLIELSTGILSLLVYRLLINNQIFNFQFSIYNLIFNLLITYILMAIFLSDLLYRTIPDQVVYLGIMITIIYRIFENYHCHTTACGSSQGIFFLAGLGAAGFFYLLVLLTHFKGMGLGDVKLAGLMGLFLGFPQILVAFYLAFLTGATVGVILILVKRKKMKSQIAFGPFLVVATFMALFWGEKIIKILGY